jgi:O-antigen/teichoic acid export membrane protein
VALKKEFGVYIVGEVINKLFPFLLIPYVAQSLGADEYGRLAYYYAILNLAIIFIGISQDTAVSRAYFRYGKQTFALHVKTGLAYSMVLSSMLAILGFIFNDVLLIFVSVGAFTQIAINNFLRLYQCKREPVKYVLIQSITTMISMVLTLLIFELVISSFGARVFSLLTATTIVSLTLLYFNKNVVFKFYSLRAYKISFVYLISFGAPLIIHGLATFGRGQFDRFYLYQSFDSADVGIYSLGYQLASAVLIIQTAISFAIQPHYFKGLKEKTLTKSKIVKILLATFPVFFLPFFIFYIFPEKWYLYFLGDDFEGVKQIVVVFSVSMGINIIYTALSPYLWYFGKTMWVASANVVSSIFHICFLIYLSQFGLRYSVYASLISVSVLILLIIISFLKCNNSNNMEK